MVCKPFGFNLKYFSTCFEKRVQTKTSNNNSCLIYVCVTWNLVGDLNSKSSKHVMQAILVIMYNLCNFEPVCKKKLCLSS